MDSFELLSPALLAASAIVSHAESAHAPHNKSDMTPVTAADLAAHHAACGWLAENDPATPVLSEEAEISPADIACARFWLLDPLDGTTEFIAGRPEYGVSLAWVNSGLVSAGIIIAPAIGEIAWGLEGKGAFYVKVSPKFFQNVVADKKLLEEKVNVLIDKAEHLQGGSSFTGRLLRVLCSRSHKDPETEAYLNSLPNAECSSVGACLKFVRLAQGFADYYPRLRSLHAWDIAGGHAILKAAGGNIFRFGTREELRYDAQNLGSQLETPSFEAWACSVP